MLWFCFYRVFAPSFFISNFKKMIKYLVPPEIFFHPPAVLGWLRPWPLFNSYTGNGKELKFCIVEDYCYLLKQVLSLITSSKLRHSHYAVGDRMFLEVQDFDFCSNLIKIYPNFTKFAQIYPNWPKFCQIWKIARECGRIPCIPSSYVTDSHINMAKNDTILITSRLFIFYKKVFFHTVPKIS